MGWYTGGIAEAISISKAKGAIFVVYIEGTDDQSKKITHLIDGGELGQKFQTEHFVAIKVEANSVTHQQFSEIYKEPKVPSIYFIGKNGATLDIITGTDDLQSFSKRVDATLQSAGIPVITSAPAFSQSLIQNEQAASPESNVVCENGVCTLDRGNLSGASTSQEDNEAAALSPEEKVERAKELVQKKREEKEREEKEKERLKEIERRKMGQNVQHLKKWQEDQELKQILETREKEKRENQLARERVLAQIAQDKVERLSKAKPAPVEGKTPQAVPTASSQNANTTRLQFKLPNGSSSTKEFSSFDSLQTVISYIKANMNLPFTNFRISTSFPRREYTENDYSQTLADLQLTPNAVILLLPINTGTITTSQGGTLATLIWSLFAPFYHIFGFLKNFIFGAPTKPTVGNKKPTGEPSTRSENLKPRLRDSTVVKKQGNVHRLNDNTDSDDDLNTWNGNSTQQM